MTRFIPTPLTRRFKPLMAALTIMWTFYGAAQNRFSRNQVLEDLAYLKASLEETHYDLYAYTPKEAFDQNYRTVRASVEQDSLNLLEATSLFQKVISRANNGHAEIAFPISSYAENVYAGGTLFPLELAFENGKALVRKNWSGNPDIRPGQEILDINGQPMADILEKIGPQISAERPYFKKAKIEFYSFPRLYWQVFGEQEVFEVSIQSPSGAVTHHLNAVAALEGYESKRQEVVHGTKQLKFYNASAYLNPGSFSGELDAYKQFIDSAFAAIRTQKSRNLILDLRNHPGGEDAFGDYLVAYFADQPFTWTSKFTLKTSALLKEAIRKNRDTTNPFWKEALDHQNGTVYEYGFEEVHPQPAKKRFRGQVFVLVNRQSHSQSAVTAAQIQDYGFGTIVGEETGDYPSLYASVFRYPLPHTGVMVQVPKGYMVRVNGSTRAEGVIPDIYIQDHLLDEQDEILEGILKRR